MVCKKCQYSENTLYICIYNHNQSSMEDKNKKHLQVIVDYHIWEKWTALAKENGMPLVTYIKHLMKNELNKA